MTRHFVGFELIVMHLHRFFPSPFDGLIKMINISFTRFGSQVIVTREKTPSLLFCQLLLQPTLVFDCSTLDQENRNSISLGTVAFLCSLCSTQFTVQASEPSPMSFVFQNSGMTYDQEDSITLAVEYELLVFENGHLAATSWEQSPFVLLYDLRCIFRQLDRFHR